MLDRRNEDHPQHSQGHVIHWAAQYDRLLSLVTFGREGRFRRRIIEAAELAPGQRVLDVGCGTGTLALAAVDAVGPEGRVEGIDPSPEMIARARSKATTRGRAANFQVASIASLPFSDRCFDAVLSSLMFHHLSEPLQESGLAEIHRVLAPGGRLTIIDFVGGGPLLHRIAAHFVHHTAHDDPHSVGNFERLSLAAMTAGFQNVEAGPFKPRFLGRLSAESGSNV